MASSKYTTMTDSEANELRLVANEIMRQLYEADKRDQLNLLGMYAKRAIEEIDKAKATLSPGRVKC